MRIFKNKRFSQFARKNRILDADLCHAIAQIRSGLVDASLGGGVVKQRVAREGEGKSGGFRTVIAIQIGRRAFFIFAFAKNEQPNISPSQLLLFRSWAKELMEYDDSQIEALVQGGGLIEVFCN